MKGLAILFVLLNFMDYLTTRIGLFYGAREFNPLADYFIQRGLLEVYKLSLMVVFFLVIWYIYTMRSKKRAKTYVVVADVILGIVVVWNTVVMVLVGSALMLVEDNVYYIIRTFYT